MPNGFGSNPKEREREETSHTDSWEIIATIGKRAFAVNEYNAIPKPQDGKPRNGKGNVKKEN